MLKMAIANGFQDNQHFQFLPNNQDGRQNLNFFSEAPYPG